MSPMGYNNKLSPGFEHLANDFFNGFAVREPAHYNNEHLRNLLSGYIPEFNGFNLGYFEGDWSKVFMKAILTYDMKLSKLLHDLVQNNKFEKAARSGAALRTVDFLKPSDTPKAGGVTDLAVTASINPDRTPEEKAALALTALASATPDHTAEDEADRGLSVPGKNAKRNARKRAAKKVKSTTNNNTGEGNSSNGGPSASTPVDSPAGDLDQADELPEVAVPAAIDEPIAVEKLINVKEPTKTELPIHTGKATKAVKPTKVEEFSRAEQQLLEAIFNPPVDSDRGEWNLVHSRSSRKPGKLRGDNGNGSALEPSSSAHVSARDSYGMSNSTQV